MTTDARRPTGAPAIPVLLFLVLLATPAAAQVEPEPRRTRFLAWAYQDAVDLVGAVSARRAGYALGGTALLLPLSSLDPHVSRGVQKIYHGSDGFGRYLDVVNELGGPRATLPVAGLFGVSLLTDDAKLQDAAFTSLQALVYAGAISYGVKYAVGRFRPHQGEGSRELDPFSGNSSFPSGHTTTAFAIVTPWVLYYPHPVTYGLFAVSTGTAVARVARDKHWATDVVAGGALGFLTAYYLTKQHLDDAPRVMVVPGVADRALSLSVRVEL